MDGSTEGGVCGEVCLLLGQGDDVSVGCPEGGKARGMGVVGVEENRGDGGSFSA